MSKPTRATKFIHSAADRMRANNISINASWSQSTVEIKHGIKGIAGYATFFMQDDEADTFISEANALCVKFPSLDRDTALLALAEQYTDLLEEENHA